MPNGYRERAPSPREGVEHSSPGGRRTQYSRRNEVLRERRRVIVTPRAHVAGNNVIRARLGLSNVIVVPRPPFLRPMDKVKEVFMCEPKTVLLGARRHVRLVPD